MVRLLSGLQVWQICENYFLFIVLKADLAGKMAKLQAKAKDMESPAQGIVATLVNCHAHLP